MGIGAGVAAAPSPALPTDANARMSLTVSACPLGHGAGSEACAIGRSTSNVWSQVRQRKS